MLLLSLLLAVLMNYVWEHNNPLHRDHWLTGWRTLITTNLARLKITGSTTEFAVALAVSCTAIILVSYFLERHWPFLFMVFAAAVLLYSLGRGELTRHISEFIVAEAKFDWHLAVLNAQAINTYCDDLNENDWLQLNQRFLTQCSYLGFERFFAVVFWFVLIGPAGAFAYRFTQLWLHHSEPTEISPETPKIQLEQNKDIASWLWLIEWPAIRALGLSYAITGNFSGCMYAWKPTSLCRQRSSQATLIHCVLGALAIDEKLQPTQEVTRRELEALEQLQARTQWCWLVVIALILLL